MKTNILVNMTSILNNFAKRIMMVTAVVMMVSSAWGMSTSDIESSAATTITDGASYVIATAYNGDYLTPDAYNDWAPVSSSINDAAIYTAHGSATGFYLTCVSGTMVVAASGKFYAYDSGTTNNLKLGASGEILSLANDAINLRKNTGTPGGGRWYNGTTGSSVYLYKIITKSTITYSAEGGTCATSSEKQSVAGAPFTLPSASPSATCAAEGWVFAGWKQTSAQSETTSIPTLYAAGSKYWIHGDETLYAVYRLGNVYTIDFESADNTYTDWTFTRITSQATDSYVTAYGSYIGLTTSTNPNSVETKSKIGAPKEVRFKISKTTTNTTASTWQVYTSDGSTWTSRKEQDAKAMLRGQWLEVTQDLSSYSNVYVKIEYTGAAAIRAIDDVVLSCATYNSNPSCCAKLVALSAGTETNATISSFSPSSVPTCGTGEDDRKVTITVAAATGYEFTSSARLSYSGDGTAAYVSGPTGTGPYTFVYQFSKDNDGSGSFSVTSATPKTYTVTLDGNGGIGHTANVTATYNSSTLSSITPPTKEGYRFDGWYSGSGGTGSLVINTSGALQANVDGYTGAGGIWTKDATCTLYAKWTAKTYDDYRFTCADWAVTGPSRDTVFITSTANTKVRSQEAFHVTASGLPASTALTFATFPTNTRFEFKKADGSAIETDEYGKVNTDFYIFYTPTSGDTSDGLDEITKIYVSVSGEPRKDTLATKTIIGRHLPENFVIAAKKDGKWWAMPSNMASTTNPTPVEIAVNDATNPSIAYTVSSTYYGLAGPTAANISGGNGQYIRFAMSIDDGTLDPHAAPLFGTTGTTLGKSGSSQITSDLSEGNWWKLVQTNTSITNPQDAKYTIYCANNAKSLTLEDDGLWGLYATNGTDVDELRLIPASTVVPTEAYFVEWSRYGGVIEVDAGGVGATKVQAVLNGTESAVKTLSQTCTSVKNRASAYNYTLNFNDVGHVIDFAAAASNGSMLTLRWLDNSEDLVAVSNITVPKIIASNTTMSSIESGDTPWSKWEVHVLPGAKLTADAGNFSSKNVTIKHLEIYQNATVEVTKGSKADGTLIATTLVLRNGWSRAGEKTYDVARLYVTPSTATLKATNVYADWYIDYDQYYPVAVPWNAATASFTYRYCTVSPSVGPEANIRLRYYDGNSRATNVQEGVGSGANWKAYGDDDCDDVPDALLPSHGYIMTAKRPSGKAFSIIRMPLTLPSGTWADGSWTTSGESGSVSTTHKDEIAVTAHNSGSTPGYAQGWNLIANPYMALHQGALTYNDGSGDEIEYANVPDINFTEYDQLPIATTKLKPSSAFLVQAPKNGTVTFGTANRKASAPSSYRNEAPKASKQKAYIFLNGNEAEDQMGIIIGEQYTAAYELNADLEKLLSDGTSLRTYMRYGDRNMAYVAINAELAKELIPVTVRIPANGEYVFSLHEASTAGELEGIYLTDYLTGVTTNLLYDSYMFTAEAGTNAERFAINAIVGERKTPTGVDIPGVDKNGTEPVKFIWHDKVYILHNNVIYDSTGKRVNVINK